MRERESERERERGTHREGMKLELEGVNVSDRKKKGERKWKKKSELKYSTLWFLKRYCTIFLYQRMILKQILLQHVIVKHDCNASILYLPETHKMRIKVDGHKYRTREVGIISINTEEEKQDS